MSRKLSISVGLAVLMVLIVASFAWAQTPAATVTATATAPVTVGCPKGNFVDENDDGVCDYDFRNEAGTTPQYGWGMGYGMMHGEGMCDQMGHWNRQGMGRGQMNPMGRGMMGQGWHR